MEGGPASSVQDVNQIYEYFGDTSDTYATLGTDLTELIGVDYGDGLGKALRGTVRICVDGSCPFANAFWNGEQMAFGEGVSTDDITGHELAHGVTQNTSGLAYLWEAGAINESLSDIFGEIVDLTNGSADDTPANRWLMGEGSSLGAIRSMSDPTQFDHPDKMTQCALVRRRVLPGQRRRAPQFRGRQQDGVPDRRRWFVQRPDRDRYRSGAFRCVVARDPEGADHRRRLRRPGRRAALGLQQAAEARRGRA